MQAIQIDESHSQLDGNLCWSSLVWHAMIWHLQKRAFFATQQLNCSIQGSCFSRPVVKGKTLKLHSEKIMTSVVKQWRLHALENVYVETFVFCYVAFFAVCYELIGVRGLNIFCFLQVKSFWRVCSEFCVQCTTQANIQKMHEWTS